MSREELQESRRVDGVEGSFCSWGNGLGVEPRICDVGGLSRVVGMSMLFFFFFFFLANHCWVWEIKA